MQGTDGDDSAIPQLGHRGAVRRTAASADSDSRRQRLAVHAAAAFSDGVCLLRLRSAELGAFLLLLLRKLGAFSERLPAATRTR
jgi:hypothetical protein